MIDALIWKFGYKNGLVVKSGQIVEWPWGEQPSDQEILNIVNEYNTVQLPKIQALDELESTDKDMARVAEDIIDLLIFKGILTKQELPATAREKIEQRKILRSKL